jgi:hypothetical protein
VRTRAFPTPEHTYSMKDEVMKGGTGNSAKSRTAARVGPGARPGARPSAGKATKKPKKVSSKA